MKIFDLKHYDSQGICAQCKHFNKCPGSTKGTAACRIECPTMTYPLGGGEGWRSPPEPWEFKE